MKNTTSTNGGRAMMVVSIGNWKFTRHYLQDVITYLSARHSELLVIVGDDLMVYNRLSARVDPDEVNQRLAQYRSEKLRSLKRIRKGLGSTAERVSLKSYGDFCDQKFAEILRRFFMFTLTSPELRSQVLRQANWFVESRNGPEKQTFSRFERTMAANAYLMDETAWSMHLAANHGVEDQYYPGKMASLLRAVYQHEDRDRVMEILGVPLHSHRFWNVIHRPGNELEFELELSSDDSCIEAQYAV